MSKFLSLRGVCDAAPLSGASAALAMTDWIPNPALLGRGSLNFIERQVCLPTRDLPKGENDRKKVKRPAIAGL